MADAHGSGFWIAGRLTRPVLRWVSSTLTALPPSPDCTGRLGGDEFALLLPGLSAGRGARRRRPHRRRAGRAHRRHRRVACHPADGATGDELHRHADADLYRRKSSTRSG
jgi:GGDEF domain-containing protein